MPGAVHDIASLIADHLNRGLDADDDVIFFVESTLGLDSPAAIESLLSGEENYGNGIIDLIFTASQTLRLAIEPLIPRKGLSAADTEELTNIILDSVRNVPLRFPGVDTVVTVALSRKILGAYISHLKLWKAISCFDDADLFSPDSGMWYRSARLSVRDISGTTSAGGDTFIKDLTTLLLSDRTLSGETALEALTFVLKRFSESGADADYFSMIAVRKRACGRIIAEIAQFNDFARRYSMEYLLSLRINPPAADIEELYREIYLADLVCQAVFGRTAPGYEFALDFDVSGLGEGEDEYP